MLAASDEQIHFAERILFGSSGVFDQERKAYINEWRTCDLEAVPGSGKTTVLLAKLIILEKQLPLEQNGNILVISHTNAAVEEIRRKIAKHCPRLFSEPHFIGTIQSFVDKFLAIPFFVNKYKRKPIRIDDEIYNEYHVPNSSFQSWLDRRSQTKERILFHSRLINADTVGWPFSEDSFPLKNKTSNSYKELLRIKKFCIENGFLCFDDAYLLAFEYLSTIPKIRSIIQKRFHFVYIDEMQDMDKHQYELIEQLFGQLTCPSQIQRIGDRNQAIFNDDAKLLDIWKPRPLTLHLSGSHRLHSNVASVVQGLALHPNTIQGLRCSPNGAPIDIKPHLLVYTDTNKNLVISEFARLIQQFKISGHIQDDPSNIYKAICWTTKKEVNKTRICDFYEAFSKEINKPQINYSCLESYLHLCDQSSFAAIRKNILNAFLRVFRLINMVDVSGKIFTKRTLLSFLQLNHASTYQQLKLKIYQWCCLILKGDHVTVLTQIKTYLVTLISLWPGKNLNRALTFINSSHILTPVATSVTYNRNNICFPLGIPIEVTTIHAVKGQTHTATLYLESYYQKSIQNAGNYESERLGSLLNGLVLTLDAHEFIKQSMKMAYVGFSRPTHLLCFAVHECRFRSHLNDLNNKGWEIAFVPESDA